MGPVYFGQLCQCVVVIFAGEVVACQSTAAQSVKQQFEVGVGCLLFGQMVEIPQHVALRVVQATGCPFCRRKVLKVVGKRFVHHGYGVAYSQTYPQVEVFAECEVGAEAS